MLQKNQSGGRGRNSEISELLKLKTQLSDHLTKVKNETEEISVRNRLQKLEEDISNLSSARNVNIVKEHVQNL